MQNKLTGHGILKCKKCKKIIAQCRCMDCVNVQYTTCVECLAKGDKNADR
jgi:hypothetical protein